MPSNNPRSLCQGSYASWKPLKTLECQESDFKALKVLEFRFRSLKVLEFLLKKIENVLHNLSTQNRDVNTNIFFGFEVKLSLKKVLEISSQGPGKSLKSP